jgi:hypothetical protein
MTQRKRRVPFWRCYEQCSQGRERYRQGLDAPKEAARLAKEEADRVATEEAARRARAIEEAARLAIEEAARRARAIANLKEAARLAKEEADRVAIEEAARCAKEEGDRLAKEAARRAKEEADRVAKVEQKEAAQGKEALVYTIATVIATVVIIVVSLLWRGCYRTTPLSIPPPSSLSREELERQLGESNKRARIMQLLQACVAPDWSEFVLEGRLGIGSYSLVMKCRPRKKNDWRLAPLVAVKMLLNYGNRTTEASVRVRPEFTKLAQMHHPSILHQYGVRERWAPTQEMLLLIQDVSVRELMVNDVTGQPLSTTFVFTEYCPMTLKQYLREHGRTRTPVQVLRMCWDFSKYCAICLSAMCATWISRQTIS